MATQADEVPAPAPAAVAASESVTSSSSHASGVASDAASHAGPHSASHAHSTTHAGGHAATAGGTAAPVAAGRMRSASHVHGPHDDRACVVRGYADGEAAGVYAATVERLTAVGALLAHGLARDGSAISVLFESAASVDAAIALHESGELGLPGRDLHIERVKADPKTLVPSSATIVLKNLAYDLSLDDLKTYLSTLSPSPVAVDMYVAGGRFNGVAFARYASTEDARRVMQQVHGTVFGGRTVKAEYKRVKAAAGSTMASPSLGPMASPALTGTAAPGLPFPFGSPLRSPASSPSAAAAFAIAGITAARDIPFLSLGPSDASGASPALGASLLAAGMPPPLGLGPAASATSPAPTTSTAYSSLTAAVQARIAQMHGVAPDAANSSAASRSGNSSAQPQPASQTSDASSSSAASSSSVGRSTTRFSVGAKEFVPSPQFGPVTASFSSPLAAALLAAMPPEFALSPGSTIDGVALGAVGLSAATPAPPPARPPAGKRSEQRPRSKTGTSAADMAEHPSASGRTEVRFAPEAKDSDAGAAAPPAGSSGNRDRSHTIDGTAQDAHTDKKPKGKGKKTRKDRDPEPAKDAAPRSETASPGDDEASSGRRTTYTIRPLDGSTWRQREAARAAAAAASITAAAPSPAPAGEASAATPEPERRPRTSSVADSAAAQAGAVRYARGPQADDHGGRGFGRRISSSATGSAALASAAAAAAATTSLDA